MPTKAVPAWRWVAVLLVGRGKVDEQRSEESKSRRATLRWMAQRDEEREIVDRVAGRLTSAHARTHTHTHIWHTERFDNVNDETYPTFVQLELPNKRVNKRDVRWDISKSFHLFSFMDSSDTYFEYIFQFLRILVGFIEPPIENKYYRIVLKIIINWLD